MIKTGYKNIPASYLKFIDKFRNKLKQWIEKGEMGIKKTKVPICHECMIVFRYLIQNDHLKDFLLVSADDLPSLIGWIETRFPELAKDRLTKSKPRSPLYECLSKAFDTLGYHDPDFPGFEITQESGIKACPYCNAEEIIVQNIVRDGLHIRSSQLDHFYSRELFPYLSISLYNLIPSGSICNGGSCKHGKDSYAMSLINPFCLRDSNGFLFELDIIRTGILKRKSFRVSCGISTNVVYPPLGVNEGVFHIRSRYEKELEQAQIVWEKHREVASKGYRKAVSEKAAALGESLTFEDWIGSELQINPYDFNKKKLSKLSMDIWWQLDRMRI